MTTYRGPATTRRVSLVPAIAFFAALAAWALPALAAAQSGPQIWFIRHGESEINVTPPPRPTPDGGVTYPLTRKGVEQANALADALANVPVTTIYTSTYLRAVQTADAIAFKHTLTLSLAPEAIEINLGVKNDGSEDVRAVYTDLARKWLVDKELDYRHGEGESFTEVQRRFLPFVREVMNRHAHDSGVIVIVAHSATLAFMVPVLATNIPSDFVLRHPLPNTGIIKTELRDSRLIATEWAGITDFGE